ncbi:hypothetical protein N7520_006944 [Penicillium odoratum]|uniref:uncharacterized protein n=1 Tax=Penicillium odoratum TaxID=1167516 RepID=UPI002548BFA7|nr:uncharacterized protein N7520_006944 [Penicillium odoratum]KAJ5759788.1 hypothetical protein N7520_006944 [Penicillium odoratum]
MVRTDRFPADLLEEVFKAHKASQEELSQQDTKYVYVVAHEKMMVYEDLEFIIESVFYTLDSANTKTMDIFTEYYHDYEPASFYDKSAGQRVGERSVGWYLSSNGTFPLEVEDDAGSICRIYAERHEIE